MTDEGCRCRDTILAKRRQSRKEKNIKDGDDAQSRSHKESNDESEDEESMYVLSIFVHNRLITYVVPLYTIASLWSSMRRMTSWSM